METDPRALRQQSDTPEDPAPPLFYGLPAPESLDVAGRPTHYHAPRPVREAGTLTLLALEVGGRFGRVGGGRAAGSHRFFAPYLKLAAAELTVHGRLVTAKFPSLPQRAGRALVALDRALQGGPGAGPTATDGSRTIVVPALARPEPDYRQLLHALKQIAIEQELKKLDGQPDDEQPRAA